MRDSIGIERVPVKIQPGNESTITPKKIAKTIFTDRLGGWGRRGRALC